MAEIFLHVPGIEPRPSSPVLGNYGRSGTTNGVSITEINVSEPGIILRQRASVCYYFILVQIVHLVTFLVFQLPFFFARYVHNLIISRDIKWP